MSLTKIMETKMKRMKQINKWEKEILGKQQISDRFSYIKVLVKGRNAEQNRWNA